MLCCGSSLGVDRPDQPMAGIRKSQNVVELLSCFVVGPSLGIDRPGEARGRYKKRIRISSARSIPVKNVTSVMDLSMF